MAIRRVIRMGHPLLREVARPLEPDEIGSELINNLIHDMRNTLHDYGGIGLAAPQIGESVRLAIIEIEDGSTRYGEMDAMPLTVFINPVITVSGVFNSWVKLDTNSFLTNSFLSIADISLAVRSF